MELFKNTLFINLEQRTDRLDHILQEFKKMDINGERINAIKTKSGAIGCTMSHIRCLEIAKERNYEEVFICEDDITFTNPELLKQNITKFHQNLYNDKWDVLIIGGNAVPPYQQLGDFCAKISYCQTTTGYIVKQHYYDTLLLNFRESVKNLIREPTNKINYALDKYWTRLQTKGIWLMITPATVTQYENYSDIENQTTNYHHLMLDMEKPWLFKPRPTQISTMNFT